MFAWADYENLLALRYRNAGMSGASALHFAQGEITVIQDGRHRTHGKPTAPDKSGSGQWELSVSNTEKLKQFFEQLRGRGIGGGSHDRKICRFNQI
jgi:hypothetical protein